MSEKKDLSTQPGYRAFNAQSRQGKIRVSTRLPTQEELEGADLNLSSAYNQALMHGLPARAFLIRKLKKNGVWDSDGEAELNVLREQMEAILDEIRANKGKFPTPDAEADFEKRRDAIIEQIAELNSIFESLLMHTADAKADGAYLNYLVACVTEYVDGPKAGERVYESVEHYENDTDTLLGGRVRYEFQCVQRGLPSDLIANELAAEAAAKIAAKVDAKAAVITDAALAEIKAVSEANATVAGVELTPEQRDDVIVGEQTHGEGTAQDGPLVLN